MSSVPGEMKNPSSVVPEEVGRWFGSPSRSESIPPVHVREWLSEVVRTNYRMLYFIAYGYFHNPSIAEDAVQSAVLKGLQHLSRLREPGAVLGWLATITRNDCLQVMRRGVASESLDEVHDVVAPDIEVDRFEELRLLLAAVNRLPDKLASVVRLRFFEECAIPEIAERLGLRRNTVDVRLHRALQQLAKDPVLQALKGGQ